jgi:hypothetical protein
MSQKRQFFGENIFKNKKIGPRSSVYEIKKFGLSPVYSEIFKIRKRFLFMNCFEESPSSETHLKLRKSSQAGFTIFLFLFYFIIDLIFFFFKIEVLCHTLLERS